MPVGERVREHDAVWARQLIAELKERGIAVPKLLSASGLSRHKLDRDDYRVPFKNTAMFFELAADAAGDDSLGLHFAQSRDPRDAGLIGYVGLSSATVGDAIKNMARYRRVANAAAAEFDTSRLDNEGVIRWRFERPAAVTIRQYREFGAANFLRALRLWAGREFRPLSVAFVHPRNSSLKEFDRFFGCSVTFAAPANEIVLKIKDLQLPIYSADDRLLGILRRQCEQALSELGTQATTLVEQVEREVADRLAKGEAKLNIVAKSLGMGPRTLARRLSELDTSFKIIVENLRQALAVRYLTNSDLSLTDIAFLLGYAEISVFTHAFKRWKGQSPLAFRLGLR